MADAEQLRALVAAEGFRDITIESVAGSVRFPSVSWFVQDCLRGSPFSGHVDKVSDETRGSLIGEVGDALMSYVADEDLKFPIKPRTSATQGNKIV